jgi:hypothetical protein
MPAQHSFAQVPQANIPRSTFNRSHGYKTTLDSGYLVPFYLDEALPGDTHMLNVTSLIRLATPIVPLMDNIRADFHFFSVPIRLIWDNFKKFMGEQTDPDDSIDYECPKISVQNAQPHSLWDYFGVPTEKTWPFQINTFWNRAYNLIWNEWYRDQNLQDSVQVDTNDGGDTMGNYVLLRRGKRHDYFTSALPWPQKGESVLLPFADQLPVFGLGKLNDTYASSSVTAYESDGNTREYASASFLDATTGGNAWYAEESLINTGYPNIHVDTDDISLSVNEMRESFQLQKLLERDARSGTRYIEKIKAHFGVISPDARQQRPEFLGGGSMSINITPVAQTSSTDVTTPQGNLAGYGVGADSPAGFTASFTEHCVILGLVSIRADLTYQQGIDRMFLRNTQYDFYWPALAQIGEQVVFNQELFYTDEESSDNNEGTFGYQERYAEYRYKPSKITGLFRSDATGSIDVWHLAQDFASLPTLGDTFIQENPPIDRVIAVPTEPQFLMDCYINLTSVRPMPVFGVPGNIDHF